MLPTIYEFVSKYIIGAKIKYTDDRAKKGAYNREKGIRRLERLTSMVRSLKATSTKEIGPMVSFYAQTHRSYASASWL